MSVKIMENFRSPGRKAMATQKKMFSGLSSAPHGHRIYCIIKAKSKFTPV